MNILDKQSPNGTGGGSVACAQSPSLQPPSAPGGPITPSSADCLLGSSSGMMPNPLSAPPPPPSSAGPSSVSSSSAPHTPLDTLNSTVNCQQQQQQQQQQPSDLITNNGLPSTRPNVSTPSSVFNSSAPNTPMPCSVGSDAPITSPAINHQLEMYNSGGGGGGGGPVGPGPPPSQVLAGNNNLSNAVMSPSPLNVPPAMCSNDSSVSISGNGNNGGGGSGSKKGAMSNGTGSNKKHCNNRNQNNNNNSNNSNNSNFANMSVKCENNAAVNVAKNHMNFPPPNSNMACGMPNGSHNGSNSPFDADHKMGSFMKSEYINDFGQPISNEMIPPPVGNMPRPPMMNCGVAMNMQQQQQAMQQPPPQHQSQQPGNMNAPPGKMCAGNLPPHHGLMKPPPMDQQYMQCQSQIFVFNTTMVNQAAEAVDSGSFESIIDYHLSTPNTKSFIEKHSLKLPIQNKPNNFWQGNIRPPRMRGPNTNGMCGGIRVPNNFNSTPCYPYNHNPPGPGPGGGPQWSGPNNWPGQPQPPFPPNDMNNMNKMANCNPRPYGPQYNGNAPYPLDMQDLTPQQKQHRENKLAILANLQQKLCPELELCPNNRPLSQPPQPNEFPNVDAMGNPMPPLHPESDPMNPMLPSDSYNPSFPPNPMMSNQPGGGGPDPWAKAGGPFPDEKPPPPFNGRRKGSQGANQVGNQMGQHQSPLSQQSINSPSSCVTSSPGTRVPPPPYNTGLRTMSSPHPASPAGTSLSLPSPRMHPNDTRQQSFTPGGVRSGPATPASADAVNCGQLINSPKSSSRQTNSSPGSSGNSKKAKSSSLENDLALMNAFPPKAESAQLMPVPSPKQIDYNNFDGHELVIHKQPNAHFQDNELLNSGELANDLYPNDFMNICSSVNSSGAPPNMPPDMNPNHRFQPNSCNYDSNPKFPPPDPSHRYSNNNGFAMDGYRRPSPNSCPPPPFNQNEAMRYPNCDPAKNRINSPADIAAFSAANSMDMNMMTNSMPPMGSDGASFANGQSHSFGDHPDSAIGSSHLQNLQKMTPPFDKDGMMATSKSNMPPNMVNSSSSSSHMVPNSMHPNIPQNPNHRMPNFDPSFPPMPCSDMNEPNNFGPGPGMHPPNMPPMGGYPNSQFTNSPRMPSNEPPFGMHHSGGQFPGSMPMNGPPPGDPQGGMNGPNPMMMPGRGPPPPPPPQQQPQPPNARFPGSGNRPAMNPPNTHNTRYNSPNIQVKPDAPNTIQYLPSRPQGPTSTPPSRPPNLDFLQQSLSMGGKPSGGQPPPPPPQQQGMPPGPGNNGPYFGPSGPGPGGPMGMPPRGPPPPMQGHMNFNRPQMMRPLPNMQNGPPGMGGGMQMGGQGGPPPPDMYNRPPGPNSMVNGPGNMPGGPPNFGGPPGGKAGGPMGGGMGHPGEGNQSFNSFMPSFPNMTTDPAYAAEYNKFQQQLYATNTRNSASNPRMTSNF